MLSPDLEVGVNDLTGAPDRADGQRLREALLAARNADHGWAYHRGKHSRIEPTAWALLALAHTQGLSPDLDVFRSWPRHNGWLVDLAGSPPNHAFNAIAALTILQDPSAAPLLGPIVDGIVAAKGIWLPTSDVARQNGSLQAWSWIEGTASWVEPTACCLVLLKKLRANAPADGDTNERIAVGEQMLIDRACHAGGWNYGNSAVLGQELWPYVPTTALALLALQDRRDHPVVQRSLAQLQKDVMTERSVVSLALYVICLRVYGIPAEHGERELAALCGEALSGSVWDGNLIGLAMALYALSSPSRVPAAFTI